MNVFECVADQHDLRLVLVALLVCVLGNVGFYVLLMRSTFCINARRRHWLLIAAIAEGITVWATHFVAMLAYRGSLPVEFDLGLTILSVVIAITIFWATVWLLGASTGAVRCIGAGALAALGITAMHMTGMISIIAPARLEVDRPTILLAWLLSSTLFAGAFYAFRRMAGWSRILLPAAAAVLSIVVLHFTAMSATTLIPEPGRAVHLGTAISRAWLVPAIVMANFLLIGFAVIGAFVDRWLTDAVGLADATLEGIAIAHLGEIIEVNTRLAELLGGSRVSLIGTNFTDWFMATDSGPLKAFTDKPAEARVRGNPDEDQVLEIASHVIEYRGRSCEVFAVRDLSDRKRAQRAIEHMASHDPLTDLSNRAYFVRALDQVLERKEPFALLALDLDRFKAVNDVFGHGAGDDILCRVANILRASAQCDDVIARVGGDEFLVIQTGISDPGEARRLASRILDNFAAEMDVAKDPMAVGASIGVALFPLDASDAETLQQNADTALYRAKSSGRGTAAFFDQEMDDLSRERRALEHDLRHAIARDQFHLAFQPLVATAFNSVIGYEALLRWEHPERGSISPEIFVPIAEEIGAIVTIGEWVLRQACRIASTWPTHLSVAVNVSTVQFQVPNLPTIVSESLSDAGLEPHRLELEITETAFVRNRQNALDTLNTIRAMGVRISMDDFGTGYSSLSNLKAFPFDKIKIDRSFVSTLTEDDAARSIVRAIVGLGRSFNMPIVAEGVETEAQRQMLLDEGCPQAQGYLFGVPGRDPFSSDVAVNGQATSTSD